VTGESLGLLVEEQRTNLVTYSEQFDNAAWTKSNSTITANTIVAPDGTLTGDALVFNTTNIAHYLFQSVTLTATTYTFSCYAKYNGQQYLQLGVYQGAFLYCNFDILNGTAGTPSSGTAGLQDVGDGWYRCSFSVTGAAVTGYGYVIGSNSLTAGFQPTFTGDGYSGIFIWGAQLEAGAFPTSYIKTEASQVTRSADSASMTGANFSDWYRQDEGSMYGESSFLSSVSVPIFSIDDGSNNNRVQLFKGSPNFFQGFIAANNATQIAQSSSTLPVGFNKTILAYRFNDGNSSVNGSSNTNDTVLIVPIVNAARFGQAATGAVSGIMHIKKIAYYPQRLTNTQLQALTS